VLFRSQNYAEALSWYYKAADHGSAQAEENIGYIFQKGTGVPMDYAKAMAWFVRAAAQGNRDAENQLGWMYQFGQGVEPDNAKALSWYGLAADQGSIQGKNNLQVFTDDLEDSGGGTTLSPKNDPAILQAQRWAKIQDLHRRINEVETDALQQDEFADQLEHTGKGKNDGMTKLFNAIGSVGAVKYHIQADKDRNEAAGLREELAQTENESQSSTSVPAP
jgi:TPR repeat protein